MKALKERTHNTLAVRCYRCGAQLLETTEDGQVCPFCGWIWYLSDETLDKAIRKGKDKIVV